MIHVACAIAAALNLLFILIFGPQQAVFNMFSLGVVIGIWLVYWLD